MKIDPLANEEIGGYELAERLTGLSRGALYTYVFQKRIPFIRLSSRSVRFRRADIERWLDSRAVAPRAEAGEGT